MREQISGVRRVRSLPAGMGGGIQTKPNGISWRQLKKRIPPKGMREEDAARSQDADFDQAPAQASVSRTSQCPLDLIA
jgi:hypothetical protein